MDETPETVMSEQEFASLGGGELAYVREIEAQEIAKEFAAARELPPHAKLFMLHGADGTPIMLGDDRNMLVANAREHKLNAVSLH